MILKGRKLTGPTFWRCAAHRVISVFARVAVAAALVFAVAGCAGPKYAPGTALEKPYNSQGGLAAMPVGNRFGVLVVTMKNVSGHTLTIAKIPIRGQGIGTVVHVIKEQIAPLTASRNAVPASAYESYPPVSGSGNGLCYIQALRPVAGYRLRPGGWARVYVQLQAVATGTFNAPDQVVYYTVNGTNYKQDLPIGYHGTVRRDASLFKPTKDELACRKYATFLNPLNLRCLAARRHQQPETPLCQPGRGRLAGGVTGHHLGNDLAGYHQPFQLVLGIGELLAQQLGLAGQLGHPRGIRPVSSIPPEESPCEQG